MVRSKEDLIAMISQRLGDDNSDDAIALLEDVTDTFNEYEVLTKDNIDWKAKYEENDNEWRNKYKERFMTGSSETDEEIAMIDASDEDEAKKLTFDSLFERG